MVSGSARAAGCLLIAFTVVVALVLGVFFWLRGQGLTSPVPGQQRCVATAEGSAVALDLDQAHFTSIIVGLSVRRGLAPRAASIAMATAYQETGIRNLDYGDRDSVGLFQQRPSQGWGTEAQLMDPFFATNKFYDALVKIKDWETGDVNDIAQRVQRSGYPEAYRDHEADARVLASALTGHSPGGFTCLARDQAAGDAAGLVAALRKTFGKIAADRTDKVITISARSPTLAWAYASYAVANSQSYGLVSARLGDRLWQTNTMNLPEWSATTPTGRGNIVELTVR